MKNEIIQEYYLSLVEMAGSLSVRAFADGESGCYKMISDTFSLGGKNDSIHIEYDFFIANDRSQVEGKGKAIKDVKCAFEELGNIYNDVRSIHDPVLINIKKGTVAPSDLYQYIRILSQINVIREGEIDGGFICRNIFPILRIDSEKWFSFSDFKGGLKYPRYVNVICSFPYKVEVNQLLRDPRIYSIDVNTLKVTEVSKPDSKDPDDLFTIKASEASVLSGIPAWRLNEFADSGMLEYKKTSKNGHRRYSKNGLRKLLKKKRAKIASFSRERL